MGPSLTDRRTSQSGITLMELLISITIMAIVTAMLIAGWINLQRASAYALSADNARGTARDAISRISSELRGAQPTTLPAGTPPPNSVQLFVTANPMEALIYSAYNQPGVANDGTGTGALRLTRIWLDTSGSTPQKKLYWQRDTNGNGVLDANDREMVLATNVVNASVPNNTVSPATTYTAIFTYWYLTTSGFVRTDTVPSGNLAAIAAVQVRLIVDANLQRPPVASDLTTTVRLRNSN
jgi:type II secretory pathway pseudopilin PulG